MLTIEGETYMIQLPSRPTIFRSTTVKPYYQDETADLDTEELQPLQQPNTEQNPLQNPLQNLLQNPL